MFTTNDYTGVHPSFSAYSNVGFEGFSYRVRTTSSYEAKDAFGRHYLRSETRANTIIEQFIPTIAGINAADFAWSGIDMVLMFQSIYDLDEYSFCFVADNVIETITDKEMIEALELSREKWLDFQQPRSRGHTDLAHIYHNLDASKLYSRESKQLARFMECNLTEYEAFDVMIGCVTGKLSFHTSYITKGSEVSVQLACLNDILQETDRSESATRYFEPLTRFDRLVG